MTFTVVGTYGYVPIEQFAGRAVPVSDLYALGATLIHLLTRVSPADLPHKNSRIQFVQQVSVDLNFANWISKLTEPDLAQRFSNARQAKTALKNKHTLSLPITNFKPKGSHIQLQKYPNSLIIKIPKYHIKINFMTLVIVCVLTRYTSKYFFQGIDLLFEKGFSIDVIPHFLIPAIILFSVIAIEKLLATFGQTELYFEPENFEIKWKLFGLCYEQWRGKTVLINIIDEEKLVGNTLHQGVTLEIGVKQITSAPLSNMERRWIIQEIKEWLKLNKRLS
ncbi:hypothetical protein I8748_20270 [Nostoc sp. CENA67]|uniref:Protein kinase domain-containing protein n=1 Tax=Amazonocrinis nigriterrae CENA67 TaxID=2794033 RepID=A0A8J7L9U9_9NOST|nr:hypothetical protein [Amazonocrinis nigriterrae]MBH8564490.1 hypothetical protein [Amazonocrinis nigriterrae CENA67]